VKSRGVATGHWPLAELRATGETNEPTRMPNAVSAISSVISVGAA